jgi:hypothetical protein
MERFAELLGRTDEGIPQYIYNYDFNVFQYDDPSSATLFCDEDYLFVLRRCLYKEEHYYVYITTFLIKDLRPDIQILLPHIMEIHKSNKVTKEYIPTISGICNKNNPSYKETLMTKELWERFYKLVVGATQCKSARN